MDNRDYLETIGECCTHNSDCLHCDVRDKCTQDLKDQGIIPAEK